MLVLGARGQMGAVLAQGRGGASNGLLTGLVAYWGLDEASGNALDKHSGGLTLTQTGTVGAGAGQVYATARGSYSTTQYFSRASEAALQTGDVNFAFAAWIYANNTLTSAHSVLSKDDGTNRDYWLYVFVGGIVYFQLYTGVGTTKTVSANFSIGAWQLIMAWHDATADTMNLQINDNVVASAATGGSLRATTNALFAVGRYSTATFAFPGRIGPVAFWKNRTLSAADRANLYNGGAGLAYAGFS